MCEACRLSRASRSYCCTDLSAHSLIVGARCSASAFQDQTSARNFHTPVSRVYREQCGTEKSSSQLPSCWVKVFRKNVATLPDRPTSLHRKSVRGIFCLSATVTDEAKVGPELKGRQLKSGEILVCVMTWWQKLTSMNLLLWPDTGAASLRIFRCISQDPIISCSPLSWIIAFRWFSTTHKIRKYHVTVSCLTGFTFRLSSVTDTLTSLELKLLID